MPEPPSVFISYTARSEEHKTWVRRLASDLRDNGVDASLDQWDLKPNDDLTKFMVEGITRAEHVLLVCTPAYATKAAAGGGGVAFEHWIISGAIHTGAADPRKFYPLLRAGEPSEAIPGYLQNRYFADFRDDAAYGHALDGLLRFIYNAPLLAKPPLGKPPVFATTPQVQDAPVEERAQPLTKPRAWVLVAGTGNFTWVSEGRRVKDLATAERLGALLARESFGLVTGGWPGVDETVARVFAHETERLKLPLEDFLTQVVVETDFPAFPAGKLIFVKKGLAEWDESVALADAVVLIGGVGGTYKSGRITLDSGKPAFPLADTEGDAMQLYSEMYRSWGRFNMRGITLEQFSALGRPAPGVVTVLPGLIKQALGIEGG